MGRIPIQPNALILSAILTILQVFILWQLNGKLPELILSHDFPTLGIIFGPTIAIGWTLKKFSTPVGENEKEDDNAER